MVTDEARPDSVGIAAIFLSLTSGLASILIFLLYEMPPVVVTGKILLLITAAGGISFYLTRRNKLDVAAWIVAFGLIALVSYFLTFPSDMIVARSAILPLVITVGAIIMADFRHVFLLTLLLLIAVGSLLIGGMIEITIVDMAVIFFSVISTAFMSTYVMQVFNRDRENLHNITRHYENSQVELNVSVRERERALQRLTEIYKLQSQFIAGASHELRTPLNAILGFSEYYLDASDLDEMLRDDLHSIHFSGHYLLALINNMLDWAKIEAGKMEINPAPASIYHVVERAQKIAEGFFIEQEKQHINFTVQVQHDLPQIMMDATRISQILVNLLSNAIKFTEEGEIRLIVDMRGGMVRFVVSDTGPGISREEMPKLFERYGQLSGQSKGTGLGLPVSLKLAEQHFGGIKVKSKVGKGSSFMLYLRASDVSNYEIMLPDIEDMSPSSNGVNGSLPVVVAIDNERAVLKTYERILSPYYQVVCIAMDAGVSVDSLATMTPPPVAIIVDLLMPYQDGWQIIKALRNLPEIANVPIMVSSILSRSSEYEALCQELKIAGWLEKPIAKDRLLATLAWLNKKPVQDVWESYIPVVDTEGYDE